jgi:hypothetical protein
MIINIVSLFTAGSFNPSNPDSWIDPSIPGWVNGGQSKYFHNTSGWNAELFPTRGGFGASIGYTWGF